MACECVPNREEIYGTVRIMRPSSSSSTFTTNYPCLRSQKNLQSPHLVKRMKIRIVNRISSPVVREHCVYKTKTKIKIFFPFFISIQRNERRNVRSLRREFLETDIRCPPCECPTTERKDRFSTLTIGTTQALSNRPSDQPFSFPLVSFAPSV